MNKQPVSNRTEISPPIFKDSTLSFSAGTDHIVNFIGHRIKMLHSLKEQNCQFSSEKSNIETDNDKISNIYQKAINKITKLGEELDNTHIPKPSEETRLSPDLTKKKIKNLKMALKEADKEIIQIIQDAQIETVATLSETSGEVKNQVMTLAKGGYKAKRIHFLASVSKTSHAAQAVEAFHKAKELMIESSTQTFKFDDTSNRLTQIDNQKIIEFSNEDLDRRAGVVAINGIYRIRVTFSKKEIKEQLKSYIVQDLSNQKRTIIVKEVEFKGKKFQNQAIPLNKEFDTSLENRGIETTAFSDIVGSKGISSANREEPHLINGWETNLIHKGKIIFQALRHAIISDKYEKNTAKRQENSQRAARELLKAALLQEIASQGLTLKEAANLKEPLQLNLNSVSIVTPDNSRPILSRLPTLFRLFGLKPQDNEKALLHDQISALKSLNGRHTFVLNGMKIKTVVKTNSFNFGVNSVSVGHKIGPLTIQVGLKNQYKYNVEAWKEMRHQLKNSIVPAMKNEVLSLKKELNKLEKENNPLNNEKIKKLRADLNAISLANQNTKQLIKDIGIMMKDKKAYLKGDNQYEVGAKILLLSNTINQTIDLINSYKQPNQMRLAGIRSSFNCKSGKDRTNILDSMTKTFAMMATTNEGRYHSHEEIMANSELRDQFKEVFVKLLLEGGGLEITELNVLVKGYKVGEEIRIFGMSLEEYLQAQGLSSLI